MEKTLGRFRYLLHLLGFARGGAATDPKGEMSTDSQRVAVGVGAGNSGLHTYPTRVGCDPELDRLMKERAAEIERIVARRKPELIQQGIDAYQRDLPRLLAENRYLHHVAYHGNAMVAIAATERKLWKKLEKLGLTDMGELYTTVVAPLQIDDEDEVQSEDPCVGLTQP
ncbi:MAG: hypothetical protein ACLQGP_37430 [Isosphaeraceae bacterium]